jgi:ketosteroid isomerase-like protein
LAIANSTKLVGTIGLALAAGAAAASDHAVLPTEVARLAADNEASQDALMRGDIATFLAKIGGLSPDFVLMSPMGGTPSRASDYTPERMQQMGRFFRNGSLKQELVASYAAEDMIVLVTIERAEAEVGGLPRQPWALRVTSVFVRRGGAWSMAHRHADPLVEDISLAESARLARGERD